MREIRSLKNQPEKKILLTDEEAGILEAKEAGLPCIACLSPEKEGENLWGADLLLESMEQLEEGLLEKVYCRHFQLPLTICETERLWIRESTIEDVERFYELYEDASVTAYLEPLSEDPEEERQKMQAYIQNVYGFYDLGMYSLVEKKSGQVIGRAGFNMTEHMEDGWLELGYMLGSAYQGQGYAREACLALLKQTKEAYEDAELRVRIRKGNARAVRLAKRLQEDFALEIEILG